MSESTKSYDVIIVGAGPSGLNAAGCLTENGHKVLTLEAKDEVGKDIICGGVVGKEVFDKFNISHESVLREINTAQMTSPYGATVSYSEEKPFAYVIDRRKFDSELLQRAVSRGAEIHLKTKVTDVCVNYNNVDVYAECDGLKRVYRSKAIVLATGIKTDLSKRLGLGYPKMFLKAIQQEVELPESSLLTVFLGNEISDSAFGWAIPTKDRRFRIGLVAEDDCNQRFHIFLKKKFHSFNNVSPQVKPIAQGIVTGTFRDRVLVVGESAGQVKTTTGGGIYWGLLCSEIACDVLTRAFKKDNFSAEVLSEYERLWHEKIADEIKSGLLVRRIYSYLTDTQIERIIQHARSNGVIDFIKKRAVFDWHGKTLLNLFKKQSLIEIFNNKGS
ncbi:MAG: NAD(P)/FAD-dependent oxidoreductase [Nitrospirota bacterium]